MPTRVKNFGDKPICFPCFKNGSYDRHSVSPGEVVETKTPDLTECICYLCVKEVDKPVKWYMNQWSIAMGSAIIGGIAGGIVGYLLACK